MLCWRTPLVCTNSNMQHGIAQLHRLTRLLPRVLVPAAATDNAGSAALAPTPDAYLLCRWYHPALVLAGLLALCSHLHASERRQRGAFLNRLQAQGRQ